MMVPDDAGPVPYQPVMRPLRGERTISVAKCPKQDLNLRWRTFKVRVSSAGLFGRGEVEGAGRGFNPPCTAFQSRWAYSPLPLVQNNGA